MENNTAGVQPVEKASVGDKPTEQIAPVTLTPEQAEAMAKALEEATALVEKKTIEATNYQKGMMIAKDRLKNAGISEEDDKPSLTKEDIAEVVKEQLEKLQPKPEDETVKLRLANTELINALRNKPIAPTAVGGNADKQDPVASTYWSKEQLEDLKRRGLDPEVVLKNMQGTGAPNSMTPNPLPTA